MKFCIEQKQSKRNTMYNLINSTVRIDLSPNLYVDLDLECKIYTAETDNPKIGLKSFNRLFHMFEESNNVTSQCIGRHTLH